MVKGETILLEIMDLIDLKAVAFLCQIIEDTSKEFPIISAIQWWKLLWFAQAWNSPWKIAKSLKSPWKLQIQVLSPWKVLEFVPTVLEFCWFKSSNTCNYRITSNIDVDIQTVSYVWQNVDIDSLYIHVNVACYPVVTGINFIVLSLSWKAFIKTAKPCNFSFFQCICWNTW